MTLMSRETNIGIRNGRPEVREKEKWRSQMEETPCDLRGSDFSCEWDLTLDQTDPTFNSTANQSPLMMPLMMKMTPVVRPPAATPCRWSRAPLPARRRSRSPRLAAAAACPAAPPCDCASDQLLMWLRTGSILHKDADEQKQRDVGYKPQVGSSDAKSVHWGRGAA